MATPKKTGPHAKKGQKGKYADWITPQGLTRITGWARNGLTSAQIASNIGVNPATLCVWQNKYPEFDNALKNGREVADLAIENALFNKAMRGDTTAMIFWLKNRKPHEWRDRPAEDEVECARLALDMQKAKLEMMKVQMEITRLAQVTGNAAPQEISLDGLTNEEIDLLMSIVQKKQLPGGESS